MQKLNGAFGDVHEIEYGLVHTFFSYTGAGFMNFLTWANLNVHVNGVNPQQAQMLSQYSQFVLMQRYRPSVEGDNLLPLTTYAAKALSNDYEVDLVSVIRCRARPQHWFHGTPDDVLRKKKGAIFCLYK